MHLESLPTALQPVYQTPELNKSITIFEGNFTICEDVEDGTSLPCSGLIQWCWLPSPKLTFEANFHEVQPSDLHKVHQAFHSPRMQVHIPNMAPLRAMPTNLELFGGSMKGSLAGLYRPSENVELTDLVFHIPNFPNYRGRGIKYNSNAYRTGRLALQAAGWEVLIDDLPDTDRLVKSLESNSGYAITHVGSLKRINSASFRLEEAESFMEYLSFYLSFLTGRWSPPILWVGQLANEKNRVCIAPANIRLEQWFSTNSWCNIEGEKVYEDIEPLFPSFVDKFLSEKELMRLSISWYLEVLSTNLVSDTRIILVQATLELLGLSLPALVGGKIFGKAEHRYVIYSRSLFLKLLLLFLRV